MTNKNTDQFQTLIAINIFPLLQTLREFGLIHAKEAARRIEAGEENEVQGLLEQWLRAGKMSQAEALMTSADMFGAGVDTVSQLYYYCSSL